MDVFPTQCRLLSMTFCDHVLETFALFRNLCYIGKIWRLIGIRDSNLKRYINLFIRGSIKKVTGTGSFEHLTV